MFRHAGSHAIAGFVAMLGVGVLAAPVSATLTANPSGNWSTANGHGVIQITQCGDSLCGRIVGISRAPSDPMPTDVYGHPQCGLWIIANERPDGDGTWLGKITDPRDGHSYHAKLWVDDQGDLRLRAYFVIPAFGVTQIWHRFTGHLTAECSVV
jgi:uncharacterized protein (DUF2147 family)